MLKGFNAPSGHGSLRFHLLSISFQVSFQSFCSFDQRSTSAMVRAYGLLAGRQASPASTTLRGLLSKKAAAYIQETKIPPLIPSPWFITRPARHARSVAETGSP